MRLVLIDADGLAFHSLREALNESLEVLDYRVNNIFTKTEATHYAMFLSGGKYFRHDLFEGYKKIREKQRSKPSWKNTLKAVLAEKYGAVKMHNVEADDLVAYMYYNFKDCPVIISSPDKDLLFNITGKHFNYTFKLQDKADPSSVLEGWWVTTEPEEANRSFWASMIVGDSSDGVIGLHGKGIKYVDSLFEKYLQYGLEYRDIVFNAYIEYHGESKGIYEFQKTYRALSLLSSIEEFKQELEITEEELNSFCHAAILPVNKEEELTMIIDANNI
jgi:5'-3' exonuclease